MRVRCVRACVRAGGWLSDVTMGPGCTGTGRHTVAKFFKVDLPLCTLVAVFDHGLDLHLPRRTGSAQPPSVATSAIVGVVDEGLGWVAQHRAVMMGADGPGWEAGRYLGWVVAERAHHGPELISIDIPVTVRIEESEHLLDWNGTFAPRVRVWGKGARATRKTCKR